MSNALADARAALRDLLGGEAANVYVAVPNVVSPPCTFVAPGAPYLTHEGAAFGGAIAHYSVVTIAGRGTNEASAEALDGQILGLIALIEGSDDFLLEDVQQPGQISISGQNYLAASIEVQTEVRL